MEEDRVVRLTEFRPLSPEQPEEKSSVVTNLFNKLFRRKEQSEGNK